MANLNEDCDVMIDQIRAIDNKRLIKKLGNLPLELIEKVKEKYHANNGVGLTQKRLQV